MAAEGRRGAKDLYREVLRVLDQQATGSSGGARQRLEEGWVTTILGRVRIWRYRVEGPEGSFHPLDRAPLTVAEDLHARTPGRGLGSYPEPVTCAIWRPQSASMPRSAVSFGQCRAEADQAVGVGNSNSS
jgi:hypothetical protein